MGTPGRTVHDQRSVMTVADLLKVLARLPKTYRVVYPNMEIDQEEPISQINQDDESEQIVLI